MTAGQLIVLWYSAITIIVILFSKAITGARDNPYLIYAVIMFAAVLIYTMTEHSRANKKRVLISVSMPFVAGAFFIYAYIAWSNYQDRDRLFSVPTSELQIQNFQISHPSGELFPPRVTGRIYNLSNFTLKMVALKYQFAKTGKYSPEYSVSIETVTKPGGSSDFSSPLNDAIIEYLRDENWTGTEVEIEEAFGTKSAANLLP